MMNNLHITPHLKSTIEKNKGNYLKLLAIPTVVAIITTSFGGCSLDSKQIEKETVEIIQSTNKKTDFINEDIEIQEYREPDYHGKTDIKMTIGDIEIGPSKLDYENPDDKQEATATFWIEPKENCADFICSIGTTVEDEDNMINAFEEFIKGNQENKDLQFTNITGTKFTWKTDRIESEYPITYTSINDLEKLPKYIKENDRYLEYAKECIISGGFYTTDFELFSTRNTKTWLLRYDYNDNTFSKYELTTYVTLDNNDEIDRGLFAIWTKQSLGYENMKSEREKETEIILHGETCATHLYGNSNAQAIELPRAKYKTK